MATLALGLVGAAVGSTFFPGVVAFGLTGGGIGWTVGTMLGNLLFPEKLPDQEGPRVTDLKLQTSSFGIPIPFIYGTVRTAGNIIWSTDIIEEEHVEEVGGKGGGPTQEVTTYTYSVSMAIAFCEGEITGVRKIWADGQLIYDVGTGATPGAVAFSSEKIPHMVIYTGSETQLADPTIESYKGVGNVPAYRGTAYVVLTDFPLVDPYFGRRPQLTFEVMKTGSVEIPTVMANVSRTMYEVPTYGSTNVVIDNGIVKVLSMTTGARVKIENFDLSGNYLNTEYVGSAKRNALVNWIQNTADYYLDYDSWNGYYRWCHTRLGEYDGSIINVSGTWGACSPGWGALVYWVYDASRDRIIAHCTSIPGSTSPGLAIWRYGDVSPRDIYPDLFPGASTSSYFPIVLDTDGTYLYAFQSTTVWRIDLESMTQVNQWTLTYSATAVCVDGDILCTGLEAYRLNDDDTLTLLGTTTVSGPHYATEIWGRSAADGVFITTNGSGITVWCYETLYDPSAVTLASIVTDVCDHVDLSATDIDVSTLTETIHGYIVPTQVTARAAIEPLQKYGWFDAVESDGKIKFVLRGGAVCASIALDDLAAHEYGSDTPSPLVITRTQEEELPQRIYVNYSDTATDYQLGSQHAQRIITTSKQQITESMSISMGATKAAQIAEVLIYDAWVGRQQYEFALGRKYAYLEPTDVIDVTDASATHRVRLTKMDQGGMLIKCAAVAEDAAIYSPVATGVTAGMGEQSISYAGPTALEVLDIPLLREADDGVIGYVAVSKYMSGWRGARVFRSADNGVSWTAVATITTSAPSGTAYGALGTFYGGDIFDELNTVDVEINGTVPSSITRTEVLAGGNSAVLGDEIIQFTTITSVSGNRYTLSGLRRGMLGTEWAMDAHAIGDRFVMLSLSAGLAGIGLPVSALNAASLWRAVTLGRALDTATSKTETLTGAALKPLSPWHFRGFARDGDIDYKWVRRSRYAISGWQGIGSQPLAEDSEAYQVIIYSDSGYTTAVRTISSTSTTATYNRGDQITDFGATQSTVYAGVQQISASVGAGFSSYLAVSGNSIPAHTFDSNRKHTDITLTSSYIAKLTGSGSSYRRALLTSTIPTAGKWYAEFVITNKVGSGDVLGIGIAPLSNMNYSTAAQIGGNTYDVGYHSNGNISSGSSTSYGASFATGGIVGVIIDSDAGTIEFSYNGTRYGATTGIYMPDPAYLPYVLGVHMYDTNDEIKLRTSLEHAYRPSGYNPLDI